MAKIYSMSLMALAGVGLLTLVQQLVAALLKNVVRKGVPGKLVDADHDDFGYRAERAFYNSMENLLPFAVFVVLAAIAGANPTWVGYLALGFLGARVLHMAVYYANIPPLRTLAFLSGYLCSAGIGVMALLKLF